MSSLLRSVLSVWRLKKVPRAGSAIHPFTDEAIEAQSEEMICSGSQIKLPNAGTRNQIPVQGHLSALSLGQFDRHSETDGFR